MKLGACVGRGKTADVFEWGRAEVVKLFHDRSEAAREAKNAEVIDTLGVRAPKCSGLIEAEGRLGIRYERVNGMSLLRHMEGTRESMIQSAKIMAEVQFELHGVKVWHLANLKTDFYRRVRQSGHLSEWQKEQVLAILDALPEGHALCHYDLHPDNILLTGDGPVVIDWMNVLTGHPAADVARTSMMLQSHAVPPDAPNWLVDRELRLLLHRQYVDEYAALSGIGPEEFERWKVPTLAVRLDELADGERDEIRKLLEDALPA
ncbi:phosphotransferase [Paenibacillus arenilitoris]|uniref:Phosphotransferase n=1 Tax=Paenibacillus arenilitoris TaxID=2772299 RepID=A0A927H670_9BACL|nr:phosphotransferase [Paenibacillus arenilitoris]MBD2868264.1 phosphotransferase [Paenibacillus arenilitoris]